MSSDGRMVEQALETVCREVDDVLHRHGYDAQAVGGLAERDAILITVNNSILIGELASKDIMDTVGASGISVCVGAIVLSKKRWHGNGKAVTSLTRVKPTGLTESIFE